MPYLPNTAPELATAIVLPWTITVNQSQINPSPGYVYYRFVANLFTTLIRVKVVSSADSSVRVLESDGVTIAPGNLTADNFNQIQQVVSPGSAYFFRVALGSAPYTMDITIVTAIYSNLDAPIGTLFVSDDTRPFPGMLFDFSGNFLRAPLTCTGESGDVLPDGTILLENREFGSGDPSSTKLYDRNFKELATPTPFSGNYQIDISTDLVDTFYTAGPKGTGFADPYQIKSVSSVGVVGTTWTLPDTRLGAIAIKPGGGIAYYMGDTFGIQTFDLIGNVPGPNLVAAVADFALQDIIVLQDGTLLAQYRSLNTLVADFIRHYSAAGATLQTYTVAAPVTHHVNHICRNGASSTDFMWWTQNKTGQAIGTFQRTRISDGVFLNEFVVNASGGGDVPPGTEWGPASSCPLLVITQQATRIIEPPATILSITMDCGNSTVTITGTGFKVGATISVQDRFGQDVAFTVVSFTSTQIVIHITYPGPGGYRITVTNP